MHWVVFLGNGLSGNQFCGGIIFSNTQVRVMETLEGGKLVTRHWVSWNKEDGKEVMNVMVITKWFWPW